MRETRNVRARQRSALALGALGIGFLFIAACESSDGGNAGGAGGSGGGGGAGGSGGVETCGTCADVFTNGGVACGGTSSSEALAALVACACNGPCAKDCSASLCTNVPSDATCGGCLETSCAAAQMNCAAN